VAEIWLENATGSTLAVRSYLMLSSSWEWGEREGKGRVVEIGKACSLPK